MTRGPFYEALMMWKLMALLVLCIGGTGAPFALLAWCLGAFKEGSTLPGACVALVGLLFVFTFGVALLQRVTEGRT